MAFFAENGMAKRSKPGVERTCSHCGRKFTGALRARYCSAACKQAAYRERKSRERVTDKA